MSIENSIFYTRYFDMYRFENLICESAALMETRYLMGRWKSARPYG